MPDPHTLSNLGSPTSGSSGELPTRRAASALRDALAARTVSRDAVRDAAMRYGAAARDVAASPHEMVDVLTGETERALSRLPRALAAELRPLVAWWAAHGYHRAD